MRVELQLFTIALCRVGLFLTESSTGSFREGMKSLLSIKLAFSSVNLLNHPAQTMECLILPDLDFSIEP